MARVIPKQTLEDIRFRNDIVDVIGAYMPLQRAGSAFKALCPFHREKTPSFQVNPQRQIYHCFGCGAGGDVFSFVMQHEGLDFAGAARMLAQRAGLRLELEEGEDDGAASEKDQLYKIHQELARFYRRCLLEMRSAEPARVYLAQRDLAGPVGEEFLIGYAPNRWDSALRWGEKHRYAVEMLEKAGLVLPRSRPEGSSGHYDRFRHRVMFPIRDEQNRVIAFSGRALETADTTAKYLNSPETPIFRKSRVLYAMEKARRHIVESREAILCEGQIDVIRCHQAGFATAVASQGTAFTEEHAHVLRRYADGAVLVFDPDRAGQDAAVKTTGIFMDVGLAVRVAELPEGQDPDLFIRRNGADAFRAVLAAAGSAVSYQIRILRGREDASTEAGLMRVARAVLQTVARSPNAVQRARLVQEAAERLGVPADALDEELRRLLRQARTPRPPDGPAAPAAPARPPEEVALCEHLAYAPETPGLAELVRRHLPLEMLSDPVCRSLAQACLEAAETGRNLQDLLRERDESGALLAFAAAAQAAPLKIRGESSHEDAVRHLILYVWRRRLERERSELSRQGSGTLAAEPLARHRQLTLDLDALKTWKDGQAIIELQMGK